MKPKNKKKLKKKDFLKVLHDNHHIYKTYDLCIRTYCPERVNIPNIR